MVSVITSPSPTSVLHAASVAKSRAKTKAASSPTELYECAILEQWRREQQRRRMVKWRRQKKDEMTDMLRERQDLEKKVRLRVNEARVASDVISSQSLGGRYQQVFIECTALQNENLSLREAIEKQHNFNTLAQRDTQELLNQFRPEDSPLPPPSDDAGWRVQFPNGSPSFHFTPFTEKEYDDIVNNSDSAYAEHHPCIATVGEIFGWTVDYAPLAPSKTGMSFVAHARFSRRLRCSLDESDRILPHLEKSLWPVLVTPRSWGRDQTGSVCCQTLQSFNENALVMVCNIPGEVNLRYIALARHYRSTRSDGKRVDKYLMTVGNSEANARNREVEGPQRDVQWLLEGGMYMTITEVDADTIDVVFDQWSECLSEAHGRELYIDWIRFPVRLEQCVSPSRLLCL
ncbi:uncharacterized protein KRP23_4317 [Phytophthora ramorum]|uniref:Uncharacterized protein n=1 Tax=Phytophthora ramorum TaxID=164328 RepID=H3GDT7_PHYRM|nr:hypothetical protein KRP23_4317 [Phytophthora ramorum]